MNTRAITISIPDLTEKLTRLHALGAHEDQIDEELDKAFVRIFGFSDDLLTNEEWEAMMDDCYDQAETIEYCRSRGYELTDGDFIVYYWEAFASMVRAKEHVLESV